MSDPTQTLLLKAAPILILDVVLVLAAALFLALLPYLEELWRGIRAVRQAKLTKPAA